MFASQGRAAARCCILAGAVVGFSLIVLVVGGARFRAYAAPANPPNPRAARAPCQSTCLGAQGGNSAPVSLRTAAERAALGCGVGRLHSLLKPRAPGGTSAAPACRPIPDAAAAVPRLGSAHVLAASAVPEGCLRPADPGVCELITAGPSVRAGTAPPSIMGRAVTTRFALVRFGSVSTMMAVAAASAGQDVGPMPGSAPPVAPDARQVAEAAASGPAARVGLPSDAAHPGNAEVGAPAPDHAADRPAAAALAAQRTPRIARGGAAPARDRDASGRVARVGRAGAGAVGFAHRRASGDHADRASWGRGGFRAALPHGSGPAPTTPTPAPGAALQAAYVPASYVPAPTAAGGASTVGGSGHSRPFGVGLIAAFLAAGVLVAPVCTLGRSAPATARRQLFFVSALERPG